MDTAAANEAALVALEQHVSLARPGGAAPHSSNTQPCRTNPNKQGALPEVIHVALPAAYALRYPCELKVQDYGRRISVSGAPPPQKHQRAPKMSPQTRAPHSQP